MKCPKCGAEYPIGSSYCPKCGAILNPSIAESTEEMQSAQKEREPRPNNHLTLAIIVTIIGCMPAGIVSIVYASRVDKLENEGRHREAIKTSKKAFKWIIISLILQMTIAAIYILYIHTIGMYNVDLYQIATDELINNM